MMKRTLGWMMLMGVVLLFGTGCEDSNEPADYGNIRIENLWDTPVQLYLNDEFRLAVDPGKQGRERVDEGLMRLSIRDTAGDELFTQILDVPDNTFAKYTILENGQVIAGAGNIATPDVVGSSKEEVRLQNLAEYPAHLFIDGVMVAAALPITSITIDAPGNFFQISIRNGNNNRVLFEQTINVPNNAIIYYTVLPDDTVVATGDEIEANTYWAERGRFN